jgi:hypothetical protein
MAAGLGFKTFNTGDVLSASDTNGYLMQGVLVFADSAARSAAITSPQEGQYSYLKDTNSTEYYSGSAWVASGGGGMTNPMTTTGDTIYSSSGSTPARLGIGTTGQVLTVASGVPSWATPSSGAASFVGCSLIQTSGQSISNGTDTFLTFDSEEYDTNTFHDNSTNNSRITIPSGKGGYYQFISTLRYGGGTTGERVVKLFKNGTDYQVNVLAGNAVSPTNTFAIIVAGAVGDYFQLQVYQNSGSALTTETGSAGLKFQALFLGA